MVSRAGHPLRVAFFGTPDFALPAARQILASQHPAIVAITQPDRARGRGQRSSPSPVKRLALDYGLPVLQPDRLNDERFLAALEEFELDVGVVVAYGRILPATVLTAPRLGMINVHASLLPKYRGAAPVARAILAGEPVTGVTIMRVVKELDAGPILAAVSRQIDPDETTEGVEHDLAELGATLTVQVLDRLSAGPIEESPQDHSEATYAPRLTKAEGLIDWNTPAREIHNRVRALHPWPHAYSYLRDARYIIVRTALEASERMREIDPGTVVEAGGDRLTVAASDGLPVRILEIQPEGRRVMTAREFLAGHPIAPGIRFRSG